MPHHYLNLATRAFRHNIPVHVSITRISNPDDVPETRTCGNDRIDFQGTGLSNQEVWFDFGQVLNEAIGLEVVRNQDWAESVESSSWDIGQSLWKQAMGSVTYRRYLRAFRPNSTNR